MGNRLDHFIGYFAPERALRREHARYKLSYIRNSGYGNYGASRTKKAMKGGLQAAAAPWRIYTTICRPCGCEAGI